MCHVIQQNGTYLENMEVVTRTASRAPILFEWQPFTYIHVIWQQVSQSFSVSLWKVRRKYKAIYNELSSIVACHLKRLFMTHCCPEDPSHLRNTGNVTSRDSGFDKQRPEFTWRIRPSYKVKKHSRNVIGLLSDQLCWYIYHLKHNTWASKSHAWLPPIPWQRISLTIPSVPVASRQLSSDIICWRLVYANTWLPPSPWQ